MSLTQSSVLSTQSLSLSTVYESPRIVQAADTGCARLRHSGAHRLPLVRRLRALGVGARLQLQARDSDDADRSTRRGRVVGRRASDDVRALPLHLRPRAFARAP